MMLAALLFAIVSAQDPVAVTSTECELPTQLDETECKLTEAKRSDVDTDTTTYKFAYLASSTKVTLAISEITTDAALTAEDATKCKGVDGTLGLCTEPVGHADHTDTYHYATQGTLTGPVDNRYKLSCAQPKGHKTLKVTVTRPKDMSHPASGVGALNYFQGEFVGLYQKDSFIQEKPAELEPYMYNDHGSIIPVSVLRTGGATWPAADLLKDDLSRGEFETLNVYMSVDKIGDYEFKYGNPNIRYSDDFTDATKDMCDGIKKENGNDVPDEWKAACGTWTAIGFDTVLRVGSPWKKDKQECMGTGADLDTAAVEQDSAGAILPLFMGHPNLASDKYDAFIGQLNLAKAATAAADKFTVYVVLDIFSPSAGSLEDTDADGEGDTVFASNDAKWTTSDSTYEMCYSSGNKCPEKFRVCKTEYCHIDTWKSTITKLKASADKIDVKVLGNIDTAESTRSSELLKEDIAAYQKHFGASAGGFIDGFYFSEIDPDNNQGITTYADAVSEKFIKTAAAVTETGYTFTGDADYFVVFATGEWLKSGTYNPLTGGIKESPVLDDVDVVIAVSASEADKGNWVPYAWYPTYGPSSWGAIVTDVQAGSIATVADTMFDRGYGYVYLQAGDAESKFTSATDTYFKTLAEAIVAKNADITGRRLQALDNGVATYKWECDATQYECKPICSMQQGVVTRTVADSKCAGVAPDPCGCKCLFDAAWTCSGDDVVCQATNSLTLDRKTVGDLVCLGRGSEQPSIDSFTKRVAGACENKPVAGYYPSETCMAKAQEVKDERDAAIKAQEEAAAKAEAEAAEAAAAAATSTASPSVVAPVDAGVPEVEDEMSIESFAAAATLAAVAALA
jgi:hypothetical protein